jgi:predicted dehydrogenase
MQAKKIAGEKVKYAVVGVGWISQTAFLPGVEHTGNSEVVALVTSHEEKAARVGEKYGIDRLYSYEEFDRVLAMEDIEAVYLATPNFDHVDLAVKTLRAGVHLLLEKPMAVSVEECEEILSAQEESGAKLMIAYRLHHEPGTLGAIEAARNGEIGRVRFFNSSFAQMVSGQNHRAKNGFWAGPVADMGPYPINAVRNIFGAEPIEVSALGVNTDGRFNFEDTVTVNLKFPAERVASFVVSYNAADVDEFRVVGEKGDLYSHPAYGMNGSIHHTITVDGKAKEQDFPATDHFGGELKYFSECLQSGRNPEADGEEGLLDVRVIEAIEESLRTGQAISLKPYERTKRPAIKQKIELKQNSAPELIGAHRPSEGQ